MAALKSWHIHQAKPKSRNWGLGEAEEEVWGKKCVV